VEKAEEGEPDLHWLTVMLVAATRKVGGGSRRYVKKMVATVAILFLPCAEAQTSSFSFLFVSVFSSLFYHFFISSLPFLYFLSLFSPVFSSLFVSLLVSFFSYLFSLFF
jgi:hypothetical protein